jgi:hypothetical protein
MGIGGGDKFFGEDGETVWMAAIDPMLVIRSRFSKSRKPPFAVLPMTALRGPIGH